MQTHTKYTRVYNVHRDFKSVPFSVNSLTGQLTVSRSLQLEGTLSTYDIVVAATSSDGRSESWTITTIIISET